MNKLYQILMTAWLGRKPFRALSSGPIYVIFARGLTFTWFAFTLLWFHSNFVEIGQWFASWVGGTDIAVWLAIWLAASVVLAAWEWLRAVVLDVQMPGMPVLHSRYLRTGFGVLASSWSRPPSSFFPINPLPTWSTRHSDLCAGAI